MQNNNLDGKSLDNIKMRIDELKELFPEAVSEGYFDRDVLMSLLDGEFYREHEERYRFEWKGKQESLKLAQKRSSGTLRPMLEESKNWDTTKNLYIEGDNLEVLKLLQQAYLRQVKMIYIDPPYNTGNDFVYKDDFKDPIKGYKEATAQAMRANPETAGRYHSNWLSMMYPRLRIAKTLLQDDGVIFISIDDNEVHNLRKLCEEVFGEENFMGQFTLQSNPRGSQSSKLLANVHEYVLAYTRNINDFKIGGLDISTDMVAEYNQSDSNGKYRLLGLRQRGGAWRREQRPKMYYPIYVNPNNNSVSLQKNEEYTIEVLPKRPSGEESRWTWGKDKLMQNLHLLIGKPIKREGLNDAYDIFRKDYLNNDDGEEKTTKTKTMWFEKEINYQNGRNEQKELFGKSDVFDYPKPCYIVSKLAKTGNLSDGDIILDFFSGSATTAHAVMQLNAEDGGNRRFIMVQLDERTDESSEAYKAGYKTIADIGRERILRAGDKIVAENPLLTKTLDTGFRSFKLDTSNLKKWDDNFEGMDKEQQAATLLDRLENSLDELKSDRREIDVIYEIFLKYGVALTEPLAQLEVDGKKFYAVGDDGYIFICLDKGITVETIEHLIKDYTPGTIIFADQSFKTDDDITNTLLVLQKAEIEFRWI